MSSKEEKGPKSKEFTDECTRTIRAVGDAQYVIGGKWKLMIIIAMARGNNRFSELQKQVTGISARVLSSELKELESNGLIEKKATVGYPVVIEYQLLPYAHTLEELVGAMERWGLQHRERLKGAKTPVR